MWYVVQVRTGTEEEIKIQCEKVIEQTVLQRCFIPYYESMKRYQGRWHKETKILFPGYVFIVSERPEALFLELKKVIGLTRLLGADGDIIPLSAEEVHFLRTFGKEEQIVTMSVGIIEEDKVIVLEGPLKGQEGHIRKVDRHKRKAYLELEMFGRKVRTEVGLEIVARR